MSESNEPEKVVDEVLLRRLQCIEFALDMYIQDWTHRDGQDRHLLLFINSMVNGAISRVDPGQ